MKFYADLHIHSKYSRATSRNLDLIELAIWAKKKGISVLSTGDFTHPAWFQEIKDKLVECGHGLYRLKPEIEKKIFKNNENPIKFILSVEISTIYKKWDKTRKVHHVVFAPNIEKASILRNKLSSIGNINSDGRPILGLDSRDLLEITLETDENAFIIPAHIWTPWFSALGSKSGFDSIDDCYGDLASHIFACETGLSSDPQMNYRVQSLDKYRLVSNSDAHSASKLGREATIFDLDDINYYSILNALKLGHGYYGTVEFFPEEGKYHDDGHRKCNVCLTPSETIKLNGICPHCHKPLTIGVSYRVNELATRDINSTFKPDTAGVVQSLVPLAEILSEIMNIGQASKGVTNAYENILTKLNTSELDILNYVPLDDIKKAHSELLSEGIKRLREGNVIKIPGYDGEYGKIRLFNEDELCLQKKFFNINPTKNKKNEEKIINSDIVFESKNNTKINIVENNEVKNIGPDKYQDEAIKNEASHIVIKAGPGSGKTYVLTSKLEYTINNKKVDPINCLAITFTKKAANELRNRLSKLLDKDNENKSKRLNIHTFHSLCFAILKENAEIIDIDSNFKVVSENEYKLYKKENIDTNGMLSFDDLINLTLKLFNNNQNVLKYYQEKYKYIFVDEYQDIDESQYKLIKYLTGENNKICVIGDPNQAIYGFRGGNSKYFDSFKDDYKDSIMISLKNNYRSTNVIVDASNQIINENNIISVYNKPSDRITIHTSPNDVNEANYIVNTIEKLIGGSGFLSFDSDKIQYENECNNYSFSDFAILYRSSSCIEPIISALKKSSLPYAKYSNDMLCDKKSILNLIKKLDNDKNIYQQLNDMLPKISSDEIDDNILNYIIELSKGCNTKEEFIHNLAFQSEVDSYDKRANRISLMTLHASKGLEFNCVFIIGLEEGILPIAKANTKDEIEEERRLLYVGMTRAKEKLYLSHALKRKVYGKFENKIISPFLSKIKDDLLNISKYKYKKNKIKNKDNDDKNQTKNQLALF